MNCHSCPHSEAILRGDYDSTPWDALPCSTCKLRENTFYSVPYDDEHLPEAAAPALGNSEQLTDNPMLPAATLAQFVQGFLSLPPEQRDVISLRYQGLQYKEIAERQGVTVSCVEKRHRLAMRDWPVLKSLFPYKVARQKVRRPHR
ncbi:RNA polymerase sigma factor [Tichowtungia aerotolerans]|uniref:RNA polymerase sigma factor 70 region 4 type 2 domain-containing protein n=1 Tax=Tichowtungia aerotolerans TaxID=2697043 RepID=A0A6P1M3R4_9BACT|nr:sigma factor-like helix-turn-helix DNA-binding protein [Tichowtungia aerotolerans]QHI68471.1 hypothetical protein GT409_03050 [Tichowtungia aerotolerans]